MHYARLPTDHYLHRIGIEVNQTCKFYGLATEDITHIFFRYPNAIRFWVLVSTNNTPMHTIDTSSLSLDRWEKPSLTLKGKAFNSILTWDVMLPYLPMEHLASKE